MPINNNIILLFIFLMYISDDKNHGINAKNKFHIINRNIECSVITTRKADKIIEKSEIINKYFVELILNISFT